MFIRPTRQEYNKADLGPETQLYGDYKAKRLDIQIKNHFNQTLECSLFQPIPKQHNQYEEFSQIYTCVIYCHCNSGSRLEALSLLPHLISKGIGLFTFDFSGSGISQGEYVTLGKNEKEDLILVVNYIQENLKQICGVYLWGRSMGAATVILYANSLKCIKFVKGLVFDSGFANLKVLAQEIAKQKTGMPGFLIDPALSYINKQLKEKVDLDIEKIDVTKNIDNLYFPCMFLCSKEDTFVNFKHVELLYNRYNGRKWIYYTDGDHNAFRNHKTLQFISDWIYKLIPKINNDNQSQNNSPRLNSPLRNTQNIQSENKYFQLNNNLSSNSKNNDKCFNSEQNSPISNRQNVDNGFKKSLFSKVQEQQVINSCDNLNRVKEKRKNISVFQFERITITEPSNYNNTNYF